MGLGSAGAIEQELSGIQERTQARGRPELGVTRDLLLSKIMTSEP